MMGKKNMKNNEKKKKRSLLLRVLSVLGGVLCLAVFAFGVVLVLLTLTEYRPKEREAAAIIGTADETPLSAEETMRVVSWNIGYGALGDNADFFMDGGTSVNTATKSRVEENLAEIKAELVKLEPDIVFLQEIDVSSDRSSRIKETDEIAQLFPESESAFANNFKTLFVPYPIPPIGKVDSGIMTLSDRHLTDAIRVQLPVSFDWPVRIANLKRCLLVNRIAAEDGRELVLINLHLEAYDSGEGKAAQTKALVELMNAEAAAGNYVIAGGDFNQLFSTTDGSAYPAQEGLWKCGSLDVSDFGEGWQFLQDERVPSCRSLDRPYEGEDQSGFQYYVIDGFIVSDNIEVVDFYTEDQDFHASDHNPVVLKIRLDREG